MAHISAQRENKVLPALKTVTTIDPAAPFCHKNFSASLRSHSVSGGCLNNGAPPFTSV
jgi:hypothetical protein